jgi:glycosyltransferase involved in cell wall biosynthesis
MPNGPPRRVTMLVRNAMTHDSRVEKEAHSLSTAGYLVTVIAETGRGLPEVEERDGYRIVRIARPAIGLRGVRLLLHLRGLERALVATRPQILHAHDSDALAPVARVAQRLRIPFILDAHELWLGRQPRGRGRIYSSLFWLFYALVERRHVPRAAGHITVSPVIARYLEGRYGVGPVTLVPNYPELEPGPPRRLELRELPGGRQLPDGVPIVLHLGSAMPGRGVEQVVQALALLPGVHLVLLGAGDTGLRMRAGVAAAHGVADRVHVLPPVATKDVVAAAAGATIGVAPIIPDTPNNAASMPNKLFQYLAAGLPVVVSDLPQLRAVVAESGAGIAVDTREPRNIAAAIAELLADPARLAERGRLARSAVEERYGWPLAARELLNVYRHL